MASERWSRTSSAGIASTIVHVVFFLLPVVTNICRTMNCVRFASPRFTSPRFASPAAIWRSPFRLDQFPSAQEGALAFMDVSHLSGNCII